MKGLIALEKNVSIFFPAPGTPVWGVSSGWVSIMAPGLHGRLNEGSNRNLEECHQVYHQVVFCRGYTFGGSACARATTLTPMGICKKVFFSQKAVP